MSNNSHNLTLLSSSTIFAVATISSFATSNPIFAPIAAAAGVVMAVNQCFYGNNHDDSLDISKNSNNIIDQTAKAPLHITLKEAFELITKHNNQSFTSVNQIHDIDKTALSIKGHIDSKSFSIKMVNKGFWNGFKNELDKSKKILSELSTEGTKINQQYVDNVIAHIDDCLKSITSSKSINPFLTELTQELNHR